MAALPGGAPEEFEYIYRPYFKTKDGRIIYARQYGKRVFRLKVKKTN